MTGKVERFHLPGIHAVNYRLHGALDGGGPASTRIDPLGKGMGQMLLDLSVQVPLSVASQISNAPHGAYRAAGDVAIGGRL